MHILNSEKFAAHILNLETLADILNLENSGSAYIKFRKLWQHIHKILKIPAAQKLNFENSGSTYINFENYCSTYI